MRGLKTAQIKMNTPILVMLAVIYVLVAVNINGWYEVQQILFPNLSMQGLILMFSPRQVEKAMGLDGISNRLLEFSPHHPRLMNLREIDRPVFEGNNFEFVKKGQAWTGISKDKLYVCFGFHLPIILSQTGGYPLCYLREKDCVSDMVPIAGTTQFMEGYFKL